MNINFKKEKPPPCGLLSTHKNVTCRSLTPRRLCMNNANAMSRQNRADATVVLLGNDCMPSKRCKSSFSKTLGAASWRPLMIACFSFAWFFKRLPCTKQVSNVWKEYSPVFTSFESWVSKHSCAYCSARSCSATRCLSSSRPQPDWGARTRSKSNEFCRTVCKLASARSSSPGSKNLFFDVEGEQQWGRPCACGPKSRTIAKYGIPSGEYHMLFGSAPLRVTILLFVVPFCFFFLSTTTTTTTTSRPQAKLQHNISHKMD